MEDILQDVQETPQKNQEENDISKEKEIDKGSADNLDPRRKAQHERRESERGRRTKKKEREEARERERERKGKQKSSACYLRRHEKNAGKEQKKNSFSTLPQAPTMLKCQPIPEKEQEENTERVQEMYEKTIKKKKKRKQTFLVASMGNAKKRNEKKRQADETGRTRGAEDDEEEEKNLSNTLKQRVFC